jgi:hypothetical protein
MTPATERIIANPEKAPIPADAVCAIIGVRIRPSD